MAIEGKEWLYFFVDSLGRTAQKENGLIVFKSNYKPLRYTPDGWQDINIGWERNLSKFGINRNFSLPLGFVLDGKDILDYIALNKNFDEKLFLLIQKQALEIDGSNYYFFYDKFYRGELDLATVQGEENKTTVNIMEGSLSKQLKAYEAQNYEIPVDEIDVRMDGITLKKTAAYGVLEGQLTGAGLITHFIPIGFFNQEGTSAGILFTSQEFGQPNPRIIRNETGDSITFQLVGSVKFKIEYAADEYRLEIRKVHANNSHTVIFTQTLSTALNQEYTIPFDLIVSLDNEEQVYFHGFDLADVSPGNLPNLKMTYLATDININIDFEFKDTNIKAVKPFTLFKRLIGKITGSELNALSALLEAHPNLVVTSGDAIRGLTGAVIKTNLNNFFTSFNVALNGGLGIENSKIVFESKDHFFDESDPIPLGKVRNFKWRWATELLANSLKIGWPNQTYDDVNGRQEFNTTQERSSVVQRISKTLELVSVYRADPFGIELTRINLEGKTTTDSSSDNDVFILNVDLSAPNDDGSYNLKRETYDSITGLLSPSTVFNIEELTPARLLEKHRNWINSIFYGFEGTKLTYQTSDKNRELRTVKGSTVYDEDADFTITDTPRLLKPMLFEFEPETLTNLVELMEENPNRCFSFEHENGNIYKGYNLKIGIAPNTLEEQAFQLISTASNDLKTLVNG